MARNLFASEHIFFSFSLNVVMEKKGPANS